MSITPYLRLLKNIAAFGVIKGSNFLIPVITLPYLVRTLGLEGYGSLNFALAMAQFLAVVIQYGFAVTATRQIARIRDDRDQLDYYYSTYIYSTLMLASLGMLTYLLIVFAVPDFYRNRELFLCCGVYLALQAMLPVWAFQGTERMPLLSWVYLSTRLLFLLLLVWLVQDESHVVRVAFINMICALIALLLAILVLRNQLKLRLVAVPFASIKREISNGLDIFIAQFAPNLYKNASVFILGLYSSDLAVGAYSAALKLVEVTVSVGQIISSAVLPVLSRNIQHHRRYSQVMLGLGVGFTVLIIPFSHTIVELAFNSIQAELITCLQVLSISIVFVYLYNTFGVNYLMVNGADHVVRNLSVLVSLAGLIGLLLSVPQYGYLGCLVVVVGSRMLMGAGSVTLYCLYKARLESR